MSTAISTLIDTLNGQVKQLPSLAKTMIRQWTTSHYLIAGIELMAALFMIGAAIVLIRQAKKEADLSSIEYAKHETYYYNHIEAVCGIGGQWQAYVSGLLGIISTLFLVLSITDFYKALNPIVSLINNFR